MTPFYTTETLLRMEFIMAYGLLFFTVFYGALGAFVWIWRNRYSDKEYPLKWELLALSLVLMAHGMVLLQPILNDHILVMGFGYAVCVIVWLMLMMYFAGTFFYRLRGLQLLLYPLAAVSMLFSAMFPGKHMGYPMGSWAFMLHIVSSLLAYSLFAITALLAVLILWQSANLHQHRRLSTLSFLPPLLSLEKLMFQGMWVGFSLLTVSVVSGTFFAEEVFGKPFTWTHKTIFGILSWLIYGALLLKRSMTAWRGKRVASWTIVGFISLMLAYVGSKFVLEILLKR